MSSCLECLRGFHVICGDCDCCNPNAVTVSDPLTPTPNEEEVDNANDDQRPVYDVFDPEAEWRVSEGSTKRGKADRALKDQQSTGRKRAAKAFPLFRDENCEWAAASITNPKGGGNFPITYGCDANQLARHHGPDKNTLHNSEGNVHRICNQHHNFWHAKNDPSYVPGQPVLD